MKLIFLMYACSHKLITLLRVEGTMTASLAAAIYNRCLGIGCDGDNEQTFQIGSLGILN